jgi:tetratricopeptide (TPR) repeat protein
LTLNVRAALSALCLEQLGRDTEADSAWREALAVLEAELLERPDDFRVYLDLAAPLAALGRDAEAVDAARRAVQLMPLSRDVEAGAAPLDNLVMTHVRLGQFDEAFDVLGTLPAGSSLSAPRMRLDPRFGRLVQDPRFAEFVSRSR